MTKFAKRKIEEIRSLFFDGRSSVEIGYSLEGMKVDSERRVLRFGTVCGPTQVDPDALIHEMGHLLVTKTPRKMVTDSFGLTRGLLYYWAPYGPISHIPVDASYTRHEADVWAWQTVVGPHFGIDSKAEDHARTATLMPDFMSVPGSTEKERVQWVEDLIREKASGRTYEDFVKAWDQRVSMIPEAFESAAAFHRVFDEGQYEEVVRFSVSGRSNVFGIVHQWRLSDDVVYESFVDDHGDCDWRYQGMHSTLEAAEARLRRVFEGREILPVEGPSMTLRGP
jgi:hypothetical protein